MFNFNFLTGKCVLGLVAGIVVGAIGYKLVSEKKINPKDLQQTVMNIAGKFKGQNDQAETEAENK